MLHKLKSLLKDDLISDTLIVFVGTSIAGFFSLLYHLVSVRLLAPQDYGTFNALISLVMFGSIAFSPLGIALTKSFTEYIAKKEFSILILVIRKLFVRLFFVAIGFLLFFLLFSSPIAGFFKTENIYILMSGGIIALSLITLPVSPLFQSFQKFKSYSLLGIASSLVKLASGAALMMLGWRVAGALAGFLISSLLVILIAVFFIPHIKKTVGSFNLQPVSFVNLAPIFRYFFPVSFVMLAFTILTNIDVILVKRFFSPLDAGYYSIAQMVGKIFLFLPSALAVVILPKSAAAYATNSHSHKILYKSLSIAALVCGLGVILCFMSPELVLNILTSKSNPVSVSLVGLFSLAMSFYALLWIIINYSLATHNLRIVPPLVVLAILETGLVYFYHWSLLTIIYIMLSCSIVSFIAVLFCTKLSRRS